MAKKCTIGKSCGGTCISKTKFCEKEIPESLAAQFDRIFGSEFDGPFALAGKLVEEEPESLGSLEEDEYASVLNPDNQIGEGAYGVVYAEGDIAIKMTKTGAMEETEAEVAVDMGELGIGPKILKVYRNDSGEPIGMVMERVKGETLRDYLESLTRIEDSEEVVNNLLSQTKKMHQEGVIHSDLHDRNIMVDPDTKRITIIDWGLAEKSRLDRSYNNYSLLDEVGEIGGQESFYMDRSAELYDSSTRIQRLQSNVRRLYKTPVEEISHEDLTEALYDGVVDT